MNEHQLQQSTPQGQEYDESLKCTYNFHFPNFEDNLDFENCTWSLQNMVGFYSIGICTTIYFSPTFDNVFHEVCDRNSVTKF